MLRFRRASRRQNPIILADRARDAHQWDDAVHHYRTALIRNPRSPAIWVQFGHALKEGGSHVAAEAAYRRAIADDPTAADPYLQLGHVLKLQGRREQAKAAYLQAFSIDPTLHEATVELVALGCSAPDLARLLRDTPVPVASDKTNGLAVRWRRKRWKESVITRADRARDLGQWEIAARLYRRALDRNPANPSIWIQYGHALKEAGQRDAELAYRRALAYDPSVAEFHVQLGHALKIRGRTKAAEAAYLRAFALDPSLSTSLGELDGLGWSDAQVDELKALLDVDRRHQKDPSPAHRGEAGARQSSNALAAHRATQADERRGMSAEIHGMGETKTLKSIAYIISRHDTEAATLSYRVYNYASAFRNAGLAVTTVDLETASFADVKDADIVVLCRIPETPALCEISTRFQSLGHPVVYDIDDLIFNPDCIEHLPAANRPENSDSYTSTLNSTLAMMRRCDLVTVSTFALKLEVERLGVAAHVIPNALAPPEVRARDALALAIPPRDARVRMVYLGGTATDDDDFAVCKSALLRVMAECDDVELLIVGFPDAASEFERFGERLIRHPFVSHDTMLDLLQTADINLAPLEPGNPFTNCKSELKIVEAASRSIPTIASPVSGYGSVIVHGVNGFLAGSAEDWHECLSILSANAERRMAIGREAGRSIAPRFLVSETVDEAMAVYSLACSGQYRKPLTPVVSNDLPTITVVAPLYKKQAEVTFFLESLRRQSYRGRYEVVLIDDSSPDASVDIVNNFRRYQMLSYDTNPNMRLQIISLPGNAGNCVSRNIGIRESNGDIIVVVDADCMFNRDFLALHVQAYEHGDCDVAIGPVNIETNGKPPLAVLNAYEIDPRLGDSRSAPQDRTVRDSFVNCITRNFSIRRSFLASIPGSQLFDEQFGYSADPQSGFGWEDVEMGYRLYLAQARIKYVAATASIHVSHPSSADEREQPLRSLRNFRRLHDLHADLILVARQWSIRTYDAIIGWAASVGASLEENDDYNTLEPRFRRYARSPVVVDRSRPLKVLSYRWHCPHQYELYRLGHEVTLARGLGNPYCDSWGWDKRPLPTNARFRDASEINPRDFDVAILHFDENVLRPDLGQVLGPEWGASFQRALAEWDIPKVAVCHGTPQFHGQYDASYNEPDLGQVIDESRQELVDAVSDITVVCNSMQAEHEWRFRKSTTIWHGFSPHEYPMGRRDRGILSMPRSAMVGRPHYNGLFVHDWVRDRLGDDTRITHLTVSDPNSGYERDSQDWAVAKFHKYVATLGQYSTYFNSTIRSPMPRTRGEAMMSGLVPVSLNNYDVNQFIVNGVNGFYADTEEELAEYLKYLTRNQWSRERMGLASRRTALDLFNLDRYLASWSTLLAEVVR